MAKWGSRKVVFSFISILANLLIPVVFKKFEIGETVTLTAMGTVSAVTAVYIYGNVKVAQAQPEAPK